MNVQSLPWSFFFAFLSIVISCPPHFGTCCGAGLELVSSYSPLPSKAGRQGPLGAVRGDAGPPDGQRLSPPAAGNLWGPIFCASPTGDAKASPVGCNDGTIMDVLLLGLYCHEGARPKHSGHAGICPPDHPRGPAAWWVGLAGLRPGVPATGGN